MVTTLAAESLTLVIDRRRFTAEEYLRMGECGILAEDERVELIDGEIIAMSPIGDPQMACVRVLLERFSEKLGKRITLGVQDAFRLDDRSEPQPDVLLLRRRKDYYRSRRARPEDVLLLIEVMDSSAAYDRQVKLPRYARASVSEVWLIDLNTDLIEIHRDPHASRYRERIERRRGQEVAPAAFPDAVLAVNEILGLDES